VCGGCGAQPHEAIASAALPWRRIKANLSLARHRPLEALRGAGANASPEAKSEVDLRARAALFAQGKMSGFGGGHVALMDGNGLIFHRTLVGDSKCHHTFYKRLIAVLGILQRMRGGGCVNRARSG
jgi:hypothetical protein